ncbi:MAG: radical SAM protein [Proteobacteria bacterium]|nr:radical SAM protein [Pseudomonadota bacterium]
MKNLYFFQCQEAYGNSIYLPYTSGILFAYVNQFEHIKNNFMLADIFFEKRSVNDYLTAIDNPGVVCFSNYGWNTVYHFTLAKLIKEQYPQCVIIVGGPNSQQTESYLRLHSYVDYWAWGEGEQTLLDLLTGLINNCVENIEGISFIKKNELVKNPQRSRKTDLDTVPSPYLTGIFDHFFTRYEYNFMPVWETNRGCPYHCTFCDLGADYYNKLHKFSTDRLLSEIDWFSKNKIEYVEVADANFGILERDLDLALRIRQKNLETGFPKKINATWAKNNPNRVFTMSQILNDINRGGVTLALQSTNNNALSNIKRFNIVNTRLEDVAKKYAEAGIATYHDFILGLPGETFESWRDGLLYVIDINPESWIFGHPLEAYQNTEFADKDYIERFKLKSVSTPQVSFFAKRNKQIPIEIGTYIVETNTMTYDDYIESFLFKWFLISNHSLGWTNHISKNTGSRPSEFYKKLWDWVKLTPNCLIREQLELTMHFLIDTLEHGEFWGRQLFGEDDVYWEYESASCIAYELDRQRYFNEMSNFMLTNFPLVDKEIVSQNDQQLISFNRKYPNRQVYETFEIFCREIYWYGRRKAWQV